MKTTRTLPEHLQEEINAMPEYSYGVTRVRVTLENGSKIDDVFVGWGKEILKVGSSESIPFDPQSVVAVERH